MSKRRYRIRYDEHQSECYRWILEQTDDDNFWVPLSYNSTRKMQETCLRQHIQNEEEEKTTYYDARGNLENEF
jgi:hypothetical protein